MRTYETKPLFHGSVRSYFKPFETNLYQLSEETGGNRFSDLFVFIEAKNSLGLVCVASCDFPSLLTPNRAVSFFLVFLSGDYFGLALLKLNAYLFKAIERLENSEPHATALSLYQSIYNITSFSGSVATSGNTLLSALQKITDFAKKADPFLLAFLIPIFHNKYFRNLFSQTLHVSWCSTRKNLSAEWVKNFDGREKSADLFKLLRMRLAAERGNEGLRNLIKLLRLLVNFEKDVNDAEAIKESGVFFRERAFHMLDWIPAFVGKMNAQLFVNMLLQIGMSFQIASTYEAERVLEMADEQLALKIYRIIISIGHHATPDVELYSFINVLDNLSIFKYQEPSLMEIIPALQLRVLSIADVFPFLEMPQVSASFLQQGNRTLCLMRHFLNAMLNILEHNKKHEEKILIDHAATTVLYQIYEASLKGWFSERHCSEFEERIRLELMAELLKERSWGFSDIQENIGFPWMMFERDSEGWLLAVRSLLYDNNLFEELRLIKKQVKSLFFSRRGMLVIRIMPGCFQLLIYRRC